MQVRGEDLCVSSRCRSVRGNSGVLHTGSQRHVPHETVCGYRLRCTPVTQRYTIYCINIHIDTHAHTSLFFCFFVSHVRMLHAVLRDMRRGRDLEQILSQYTTFVKPAFEEFCLPVRKHTHEHTHEDSYYCWFMQFIIQPFCT